MNLVTSRGLAPLLTLARWLLAALLLAAQPIAVAGTAAESDCPWWDETRSCLALPEVDGAGAQLSHSLLQTSKPHKALARNKVQLKETEHSSAAETEGIVPESKHHRLSADVPHHSHSSHDVQHHGANHNRGTNALSFIQTAEAVFETAKVSDPGSESLAKIIRLPVGHDHAKVNWPYGFADAALLGTLLGSMVCVVAISLCSMGFMCGRPCVLKLARRFSLAQKAKVAELTRPELLTSVAPCGFTEPLLPRAGSSFSIPLTHHTEAGSAKDFRFDVARRIAGTPISAMVTCQPEGSTWAKVQLFTGNVCGDSASPLASCCLIHSTSDVESQNIQGAMMSWLSLLLHEKEESEAEAVSITDQCGHDSAGVQQQSRVRTCLHGIAEELFAVGSASGDSAGGKDSSMRLEVRDSLGALAGSLEPLASKPGQYALLRQGQPVLDIEVPANSRSIMLSKQGEVVAMATHLHTRSRPERPELTGEDDEYLQVDLREGADMSETALLLTCALAMVVFKPKASTIGRENVEADAEAGKLEEAGDTVGSTSEDDMSGAERPSPEFYKRQKPILTM